MKRKTLASEEKDSEPSGNEYENDGDDDNQGDPAEDDVRDLGSEFEEEDNEVFEIGQNDEVDEEETSQDEDDAADSEKEEKQGEDEMEEEEEEEVAEVSLHRKPKPSGMILKQSTSTLPRKTSG
jgi:hypothetical protein